MENKVESSRCGQDANNDRIEKEITDNEASTCTEVKVPENGASVKAKKKSGRLFSSLLEFAKKHKTLLIRIAAISGSIIVIICIILALLALNRAKLAAEQIEGKIICQYDTYSLFVNGRVAEEEHFIDDDEPEKSYVKGRLDDYKYFYKTVPHLFKNKVSVYVSTNEKDWDYYVSGSIRKSDSSGDYYFDLYWDETTMEKVIEERNVILCEHNFDEVVITQATCEKKGEVHKTCLKCGTEKIEHPTVSHNYQSGTCTECGKKQRVSINADEWYSYTAVDGLIVKNCLIESASASAGGAVVWVNPVCAHCHCVIGNLAATHRLVGVSQLKKWSKSFLCYDCNRYTNVEIMFNFDY